MAESVMFTCLLQPILDKIKIGLRGGDPLLRFLLKRMKDIDGMCQLDRVNNPESIPVMVLDNLQHPRSTESSQRRYSMSKTRPIVNHNASYLRLSSLSGPARGREAT